MGRPHHVTRRLRGSGLSIPGNGKKVFQISTQFNSWIWRTRPSVSMNDKPQQVNKSEMERQEISVPGCVIVVVDQDWNEIVTVTA